MPEPLLVADRLTKDYGSFRALDALTLGVEPGEIVGLLGPNGSGKSTALRLFLGFLKATSGRCSVAGFDSWQQSVEARRRVAYLPSELRLYETMTGRRLVRFLADLRGERLEAEADRLAKQLDVPLDKPLTQLSSGMKRKVALLECAATEGPAHRPGRADQRPRPEHARPVVGATPAARRAAGRRFCSRPTSWPRWNRCATGC